MEISFELPGMVDEHRLDNEVMPVGYVTERVNEGYFDVLTEDGRVKVGRCELEEPFVKVRFFTSTPEGGLFILAFGRRFPEHNPKTVLFGIVYKTPDGQYQLDKYPFRLRSQALVEVKNYLKSRNTHLVSFYKGRWSTYFLEVLTMEKILPDGSLGKDVGKKTLCLGNIENEKTM